MRAAGGRVCTDRTLLVRRLSDPRQGHIGRSCIRVSHHIFLGALPGDLSLSCFFLVEAKPCLQLLTSRSRTVASRDSGKVTGQEL